MRKGLDVYSIFNSISGETGQIPQGAPTTFIRLAGCNLRCRYCDTPKTWEAALDGSQRMGVKEIFREVRRLRCKLVLITGGEPLLQYGESFRRLVTNLRQASYRVQVETNGSIAPPIMLADCWVVDYKLPGSGMVDEMKFSNFAGLRLDDVVKFVCHEREDFPVMRQAMKAIRRYSRPVFAASATSPALGRELVAWLQANRIFDVIVNVQIHKILWPAGEKEI